MDSAYDDAANMNVVSHLLIRDRGTKQILLNKNVTKSLQNKHNDEETAELSRHD